MAQHLARQLPVAQRPPEEEREDNARRPLTAQRIWAFDVSGNVFEWTGIGLDRGHAIRAPLRSRGQSLWCVFHPSWVMRRGMGGSTVELDGQVS